MDPRQALTETTIHKSSGLLLGLVVAFVILTGSILLYPISLKVDYSSVQSLVLIPDISLFGFLFMVWMILLGLIGYLAKEKNTSKVLLLTAILYAVVFLGFWLKFTYGSPYGQYTLSQSEYLVATTHIPFSVTNFLYAGYPSLDLLVSSSSIISGFDVALAGTLTQFVFIAIFTAFMFLSFQRVVGNTYYAWLGTLLLITGDQTLTINFPSLWGGVFAYPLMAILLFFFTRGIEQDGRSTGLILLLFFTMGLAYMPAPLLIILFVFVLGAMKKGLSSLSIILAGLFFALNLYIAASQFSPIVALLNSQFANIMINPIAALQSTIFNPVRIASTGVLAAPFWVQGIQFFWVLLLVPFAILLSSKTIWSSVRNRFTDSNKNWVIAGLLVTLVGGVLAGLAFSNGAQLVYRLIEYVPFFGAPAIMLSLWSIKNNKKILMAVLISVLIVALALPTFLSIHKQESIYFDIPSSQQAYSYLSSTFHRGDGLQLYSPVEDAYGVALYYLPRASYMNEGEGVYLNPGANQSSAWTTLNTLVTGFIDGKVESVYVWSPRMYFPMHYTFGINPEDGNWTTLRSRMAAATNLVYMNSDVSIYSHI